MGNSDLGRLANQLAKLTEEDLKELISLRKQKQAESSKQKHGKAIEQLKARKQKLENQLDEISKQLKALESGGDYVARSRDKGNVSGRTIEQLILEVLRERNQPSRPCEIRDTILDKNWYQGKKQSLAATVSIILSRLVKEGKVSVKDKLYLAV